MSNLPSDMATSGDVANMTSAMSNIAQLPATVKPIVLEAFTNALSSVFLTAVPILIAAFVFSLFLKDVHLRSDRDTEHPPMLVE